MPDRSVTIEGMGDRGLSDAIGFVLVFAIIVSSVAIVYVSGFRSLDNARQFERMNNAERAFDVLDDNIEDMTERGAPSRATEVKLDDATLKKGDPVTVNVTVARTSNTDLNVTYQFTVVPIVFEASLENAVIYSMGATFRQSNSGTTMNNPPSAVLNDERVYLPLVQTRPDGADSVGGDLTALVRTEYSTSSLLVANETASNVVVNITTPRADAWRGYFRNQGPSSVNCPSATNTDSFVNCEMTAIDRVYVSRIAIDFGFVV